MSVHKHEMIYSWFVLRIQAEIQASRNDLKKNSKKYAIHNFITMPIKYNNVTDSEP
jgi:hypothetical protein